MRDVTRTVLRQTLLVTALATGEAMIFWTLSRAFGSGILYGSALSLICFWLLAVDVMAFSVRRMKLGYVLRYLLYAIALGSAAFLGELFFFGSVIGVFNGKVTIFLFGRWLGETQSDPE